MTSHQPPFYCPYCGEEDIRPHGTTHGEWECESCRRIYALRAVRPARPPAPDPAASAGGGSPPPPAGARDAPPGRPAVPATGVASR